MEDGTERHLVWKKECAGEYVSGNFRVSAAYSRMYGGDCWFLTETHGGDGRPEFILAARTMKEAEKLAEKRAYPQKTDFEITEDMF